MTYVLIVSFLISSAVVVLFNGNAQRGTGGYWIVLAVLTRDFAAVTFTVLGRGVDGRAAAASLE